MSKEIVEALERSIEIILNQTPNPMEHLVSPPDENGKSICVSCGTHHYWDSKLKKWRYEE